MTRSKVWVGWFRIFADLVLVVIDNRTKSVTRTYPIVYNMFPDWDTEKAGENVRKTN